MDKTKVYLVQTDTTVGFSSSDDEKLSAKKQRPANQKILQTVDSFETLKSHTRIPKNYRNRVRRAKRTTFIYPNGESFRIIEKDDGFYSFIEKFNSLYSTSANLTKNSFDYDFAFENSDIVVFTKEGFSEKASSSIYKIYKENIVKIR